MKVFILFFLFVLMVFLVELTMTTRVTLTWNAYTPATNIDIMAYCGVGLPAGGAFTPAMEVGAVPADETSVSFFMTLKPSDQVTCAVRAYDAIADSYSDFSARVVYTVPLAVPAKVTIQVSP